MTLKEKINTQKFWKLVANFAIPFLIIVTLFSLILNSGSALFSGKFNEVYQFNFGNGKWQAFFLPKVVISILYSLYMANKTYEKSK